MTWRSATYRALRPILFSFDSESIHHAALRALASPLGPRFGRLASGAPADGTADVAVEVNGLRLRNRVGLAAGFDKDGVAIRGWAALGFGFVELGTVTPRPQPGSTRPRLHRLVRDRALVNRMGFNNAGAEALAARIRDARPSLPRDFVVGVNVGRNRDGTLDDYVVAARLVTTEADYLAINVSSPNTPGLRDLQEPTTVRDLVGAVQGAAPSRPVFVKLSPDLDAVTRVQLVEAAIGAGAAGVVLSNTTTERSDLRSAAAGEPGGLSGAPLRDRALAGIREVRAALGSGPTLIGSGGIEQAGDVEAFLAAGGDLVQLWTGLIYRGPGLIGEAIGAARAAARRRVTGPGG